MEMAPTEVIYRRHAQAIKKVGTITLFGISQEQIRRSHRRLR